MSWVGVLETQVGVQVVVDEKSGVGVRGGWADPSPQPSLRLPEARPRQAATELFLFSNQTLKRENLY